MFRVCWRNPKLKAKHAYRISTNYIINSGRLYIINTSRHCLFEPYEESMNKKLSLGPPPLIYMRHKEKKWRNLLTGRETQWWSVWVVISSSGNLLFINKYMNGHVSCNDETCMYCLKGMTYYYNFPSKLIIILWS